MPARRIIALVGSALAVALVFYLMFRPEPPLREPPLHEVPKEFLTILPEMNADKRAEIEGLLKRFQARADRGLVRAEDYSEVMGIMTDYLKKGEITEQELHIVMAKVGYYSHRAFSADSSDIHPLLQPSDFPRRDTTDAHAH